LKKFAITYKWEEACGEAFETLKGILVKVPVLKLPDFDKEFLNSFRWLRLCHWRSLGSRRKIGVL
jgi:hypothetical protein